MPSNQIAEFCALIGSDSRRSYEQKLQVLGNVQANQERNGCVSNMLAGSYW